jgi:hypothetical protein
MIRDADLFLDRLFGLLETRGQDRYDESVSQLEHALQAAALARVEGAPAALVVAALLHDVGHLHPTGTTRWGIPPPWSGSGARRVHSTTPWGRGSPDATPSVNGYAPRLGVAVLSAGTSPKAASPARLPESARKRRRSSSPSGR